MSYILDALKKSEQERGHGSIPGVQTVHSSSLNYRTEKNTYWPYILITAAILNLLAILYFIVDKDKASENQTEETQSKVIENKTGGNNLQERTTINNTQTVLPKDIKKQTKVKTSITNNQVKQQEIKKHPAATKTPVDEQAITATTGSSNTDVIEFYDLPAPIKLQLPTINISAHIYSSNPLQRNIVINNKFLEEGEYVLDDLILDEITPDGAIFNYHNTRFHYGVVSGWQ